MNGWLWPEESISQLKNHMFIWMSIASESFLNLDLGFIWVLTQRTGFKTDYNRGLIEILSLVKFR